VAIYQDLVTTYGFTPKYASVKRFEAPDATLPQRANRSRQGEGLSFPGDVSPF
jgi:hypothetical protein